MAGSRGMRCRRIACCEAGLRECNVCGVGMEGTFPLAEYFLYQSGTDSSYCPLAPLGWQISVPSLKRLEASFTVGKLGENPEGV